VDVVVNGDTTLTLNFEDMALIGKSLEHYADEYENFASIHHDRDFHALSVRARDVATQFRASFGNPSIAELVRAIVARERDTV